MYDYLTKNVGSYRPSLLATMASWITRQRVHVDMLKAARHPVQVVGQASTLLVNPHTCSLLDMLLAAPLAPAMRLNARHKPLDRAQIFERMDHARQRMLQLWPALRNVPHSFWQSHMADTRHPPMHWDAAAVSDRDRHKPRFLAEEGKPNTTKTMFAMHMFDYDLEGAEAGIDSFLDGIRQGRVATETLPRIGATHLDDMPFIAAKVHMSSFHKADQALRQVIAPDPEVAQTARDYAQCIRTSTESLRPQEQHMELRHTGSSIEMRRLAMALAASRDGAAVPIFRDRGTMTKRFDPSEHAAAVYSNLSRSGCPGDSPERSFRMQAAVGHSYELLAIPTSWNAGIDLAVTRDDGSPVNLHIDIPIKAIDEPWSNTIQERLYRVFQLERHIAMTHGDMRTNFPALQLHRAVAALRNRPDITKAKRYWHFVVLSFSAIKGMARGSEAARAHVRYMEEIVRRNSIEHATKRMILGPAILSDVTSSDSPLKS